MRWRHDQAGVAFRLVAQAASVATDSAAAGETVWFRVEPTEAIARHGWIRLRYAASFFEDPVRPLIRFTNRAGAVFMQAMNGPVLGCGEWLGRVPDDTVAVDVSPGPGQGTSEFRIDGVVPVSRGALVAAGVFRDWRWVYWAARSRLLNSRQEAWQALKFAVPPTPLRDYGAWRARFGRVLELDGLDRPKADWSRAPALRFLLRLARSDADDAQATLASLRAQLYPRWSIDVVGSADTPAATLEVCRDRALDDGRIAVATGGTPARAGGFAADDRIGVLDAGDVLPDYALAVIAERLARTPDLAVVYSDEDAVGPDGVHCDPIFKPDWSPILQERTRYVGRLAMVRVGALEATGGDGLERLIADDDAALDRVLRRTEAAAVGHVRRVLYHRRVREKTREVSAPAPPPAPAGSSRPIQAAGEVLEWPKVGIVIPTRDRADLLAACVRGLKERTDYPDYEVVIVDNGSTAPDALALLRDLRRDARFKLLERPGPFNFSALSNDGAQATAAPVLAFLNNDIVIVESGWLKSLVRFAILPRIGVVGAKLLFPDGLLQHAGVVLGFGGIAGHLYRRMPADHPGYCGRLTQPHEVGAVTAACIAIERYKFQAVGGFDAANLPVDLNDMDLCLRVAEQGWTNLWTPEAVLVHLQSATRGIDPDPFIFYRQERTYFVRRWAGRIRDDPYFHPALSLFAHEVALP